MHMIIEYFLLLKPYMIPIGIPLVCLIIGLYLYFYDEIWEFIVNRELKKDAEGENDDDTDSNSEL